MPAIEGLVSGAEAARQLGVSREYIRVLAKSGQIWSLDTPVGRLYDPALLKGFRPRPPGRPRKGDRSSEAAK